MTKPVKNRNLAVTLGAALLLGACSSTGATVATPTSSAPPPRAQPAAPAPTRPAAPPTRAPGDPRIMTLPGLEGVIGATANALVSIFGSPRLDVREGDARKLQYSGEPCVLDIYLYPVSTAPEPVATWVEARRRSDGLDVDRASCVAAMRQR